MSSIFAIFDPTTFQIASPVSPFKAEKVFTKSSGAEVPKATIVRPITSGEIHIFFAKLDAPSTIISAPLIRIMKPIIKSI